MIPSYMIPAEVRRGMRFCELFHSPTKLAQNGGTVVGTVPIIPGKGASFNGVNGNYITFPVEGMFNRAAINIVAEFWPNFAANDGADHFLCDASVASYWLYKTAANALSFRCGGTTVVNVALASFQDYWYQGKRNVLVGTAISGTNYLYLNGNLIGSGAAAWTPANSTIFYIGTLAADAWKFNGYISSIKVFTGDTAADLLSAREARSYWNGGYLYV